MKNIASIIAVLFFVSTINLSAQTEPKVKTIEFEVRGVCGMCKDRIENAAQIKGVKFAEWNKKEQKIKVIYKTKKVTEMAIHKAIAEHGHDTQKVKAKDEVYDKLPGCCKYRDGVKIH